LNEGDTQEHRYYRGGPEVDYLEDKASGVVFPLTFTERLSGINTTLKEEAFLGTRGKKNIFEQQFAPEDAWEGVAAQRL